MKKNILYIVIIVIVLLLVSFLIYKRSKIKISEKEILESNNIYVEYRIDTMSPPFTYKFIINEEGGTLEIIPYKDNSSSYRLTEDEIGEFKKALIIGRVNEWDGFDKVNNNILDGEGFDFSAKINEVEIKAHGSNSFPKGYREFCNKADEIIKKYDIIE